MKYDISYSMAEILTKTDTHYPTGTISGSSGNDKEDSALYCEEMCRLDIISIAEDAKEEAFCFRQAYRGYILQPAENKV